MKLSKKRYTLPKEHELNFTLFDVNGGDAIWIRYLGNDNNWHNILIDGGYGKCYPETFGPLLYSIVEADEKIDLWIITHIDLDHIGAILGFIEDKKFKDKKEQLIKEFWFNHASYPLPSSSGKIGFNQGIKLRAYLEQISKLTIDQITVDTPKKDFWGLTIQILSPTPDKQSAADQDWNYRESRGKISNAKGDHSKKIEELTDAPFNEDDDIANGSSISLLLEFKGVSTLLLADSHPSDIEKALEPHLSAERPRLPVNMVKVSHHGSKRNTSTELLKMIDTKLFVFSANGITNKHPDKETLVRILENRIDEAQIKFSFNSDTPAIKKIFAVDGDYSSRKFTCSYKEPGMDFILINFLPITTNE